MENNIFSSRVIPQSLALSISFCLALMTVCACVRACARTFFFLVGWGEGERGREWREVGEKNVAEAGLLVRKGARGRDRGGVGGGIRRGAHCADKLLHNNNKKKKGGGEGWGEGCGAHTVQNCASTPAALQHTHLRFPPGQKMSARQTKRGAAYWEGKRSSLRQTLKATPANVKKKRPSPSRGTDEIKALLQEFCKDYLEDQREWATKLDTQMNGTNSSRFYTYDIKREKIYAFGVQRKEEEEHEDHFLVEVYEGMTWEKFQEEWAKEKTKENETLSSQRLDLRESTQNLLNPAYLHTLQPEGIREHAVQREGKRNTLISNVSRNDHYLTLTHRAPKYSFAVAKNHARCREMCTQCGRPKAPWPVTDSRPMSLDDDEEEQGGGEGEKVSEENRTFQDYRGAGDPLVELLQKIYTTQLDFSQRLQNLKDNIKHPSAKLPPFTFSKIQNEEDNISFYEIKTQGLCLRVPTLTRMDETIDLAFPLKSLTLIGYPKGETGDRSYYVRQWMWNQARWAVRKTIQYNEEPEVVDNATVHFDHGFWNIGGRDASGKVLETIEGCKYLEPEKGIQMWDEEKVNLAYPVYMHAAAILKDKLIVTGGRDQKGKSVAHTQHFEFTYKTTTTPAVVTVTPHILTLNEARSRHASVVRNNRVYVVGGVQEWDNNQKARYLGSLEVMENQAWRLLQGSRQKTMYTARAEFAAVVFRDKLYVMGGYNAEDGILESVESYNFKEEFWRQEPDMNFGRRGGRAVVWNGRIFVFGGHQDENTLTHEHVVHTVESFRPGEGGKWKQEDYYYFWGDRAQICVTCVAHEERYLAYEEPAGEHGH